jgi:hypothetical protein
MFRSSWGIAVAAGIAVLAVWVAPVFLGPGFRGLLSNLVFAFTFVLVALLAIQLNGEAAKQDRSIRRFDDELARQDELIYRLEQRVCHLSRALEEQGTPIDPPSHGSTDSNSAHLKRATAE